MENKTAMNIFVSIISHGHEELIEKNPYLKRISGMPSVQVVIKDNLANGRLLSYCQNVDAVYIADAPSLGFGSNNNFIFDYCRQELKMKDSDWFLVVNPDVVITDEEFEKLIVFLRSATQSFYTINLFRDESYERYEESVRKFPRKRDFFKLFVGRQVNQPYDKRNLEDLTAIEWASGAFLIFKVDLFSKLKGFDPRYFMYYEDVDICYRAKFWCLQSLYFLKEIKAVHEGAYKNRKLLSNHFRWYMSSLIKFLFFKRSGI